MQDGVDNHGLRNCSILKGSWPVYLTSTSWGWHPNYPSSWPQVPACTAWRHSSGVLVPQSTEKKGKALSPSVCNSNFLLHLVGQPTAWRQSDSHIPSALQRRGWAYVYPARWRQAWEHMRLPESHRLCLCFLFMLLSMAWAPNISAALEQSAQFISWWMTE